MDHIGVVFSFGALPSAGRDRSARRHVDPRRGLGYLGVACEEPSKKNDEEQNQHHGHSWPQGLG